jgi:lipopolysaccharide/colanic/teichoic acid biosynthesis glycosyltransferase
MNLQLNPQGSTMLALLSPFRMVVAERLPLAHAAVIGSYLMLPNAPSVAPSIALVKRGMDVLGSAVLLVLLSPVFLLAMLAVACTGGPVFFSQTRVGLNGQSFKCYKFRSMVPNAERVLQRLIETDTKLRDEWMAGQKLRRDPRITWIGRILRKTSIDELPQLWNVLRGDMSLVGPRPILPSQIAHYARSAKWYLAVRPGITGLWQVTARGDEDFERRVKLDCAYARNYKLMDDFVILFKTVRVVLSGRGAI